MIQQLTRHQNMHVGYTIETRISDGKNCCMGQSRATTQRADRALQTHRRAEMLRITPDRLLCPQAASSEYLLIELSSMNNAGCHRIRLSRHLSLGSVRSPPPSESPSHSRARCLITEQQRKAVGKKVGEKSKRQSCAT